jgi:hypothetical protein
VGGVSSFFSKWQTLKTHPTRDISGATTTPSVAICLMKVLFVTAVCGIPLVPPLAHHPLQDLQQL